MMASRKSVLSAILVLLCSLWLFPSGDIFHLQVDPLATDALPGHGFSIRISRPDYAVQGDLAVSLESLAPEIVYVPPEVLIRSGESEAEIPVGPLRPGPANIRASAPLYGDVTFTVNVLEKPELQEAVSPTEIRVRLGKGASSTHRVSTALSPDAVPPSVDLAFAIDGRPTFASTAARLSGAFPGLAAKLKAAFPSVSFSVSVTKFQDYGGPGLVFWRLSPPRPDFEVSRPFALLLPSTLLETSGAPAAIAAAMATTIPGSGVNVGTALEALRQIAQGAGFDGDDNGSRTDGGLAGVAGGDGTAGFMAPGSSGDVPPFSSKPASIPSAGVFGGVGLRSGAQKIVLLATNTLSVAPLDRAQPFPGSVAGTGGTSASIAYFQDLIVNSPPDVFPNLRLGPISASSSQPDPTNSIAPKGAATLAETFKILADQSIQVITLFQQSEPGPVAGVLDPYAYLQTVSRLTRTLDAQGSPLTLEILGDAAAISDRLVAGIKPPITLPVVVTLRAVGNDAGFGFSFTPGSITAGPGSEVAFDATITGTGGSGSFEIQFVTDTGAILGRIPVFVNTPKPRINDIIPASAPCGAQVTIIGEDLGNSVNEAEVQFGRLAARIISVSPTSITALVPTPAVAGPTSVAVSVGGETSDPFSFTVLHRINSFSPVSGTAGTDFTIQGCGFDPALSGNTVTFGAATAAVSEASNSQLRGSVPSGLEAGPHPVRVTTNGVTTSVGTFDLLPSVTGIVPSRGPVGTAFTLSGSGFTPAVANNTVTFSDRASPGASNAALTSATFTELKGTVPGDLTAGDHDVTVAVNGRRGTPLAFTVTPFITAVTPPVVRLGGQLRITGTGFSPATSENTVTLNGKLYGLDEGSTAAALLVTAAPGVSGTSLAVQVTTRGVASNTVSVTLSADPVILTQTFLVGGQSRTFPGATAIFERRDNLVVTVSGADPNGDVVNCSILLKDGEGVTLGNLQADVSSILANQVQFVFRVPVANSNHFTAARSALVQLKDAAGNSSNVWSADVILQPLPGTFGSAEATKEGSPPAGPELIPAVPLTRAGARPAETTGNAR